MIESGPEQFAHWNSVFSYLSITNQVQRYYITVPLVSTSQYIIIPLFLILWLVHTLLCATCQFCISCVLSQDPICACITAHTTYVQLYWMLGCYAYNRFEYVRAAIDLHKLRMQLVCQWCVENGFMGGELGPVQRMDSSYLVLPLWYKSCVIHYNFN